MKQKGFAHIILVILVIVLASAGIYFILTKKSTELTEQPSSQVQTQTGPDKNINQITGGKTSDWNTFTNTKFGYSIKYPPNWTIYEGVFSPGENTDFISENGKVLISNIIQQINFNYEEYDTLAEAMIPPRVPNPSSLEQLEWLTVVENIELTKIIDDSQTLGYIGKWRIVFTDNSDKSYIETRAAFENKLQEHFTGQGNNSKTFAVFIAKENFGDTPLFNTIISTFKLLK